MGLLRQVMNMVRPGGSSLSRGNPTGGTNRRRDPAGMAGDAVERQVRSRLKGRRGR